LLLTKEVEVVLKNNTIKRYEDLGYEIPRWLDNQGRNRVKRGTKIKIKAEDLSNGSEVSVIIQCDKCGEVLTKKWCEYIIRVQENGEYYCQKCIPPERIEHRLKTMLDKSVSFYQWCYNNLSKEMADYILSRWDYELNIKNGKVLSPKDISYSSSGFSGKGYWFKCLDHPEHGSEQKSINRFTGGKPGSISFNQCNIILLTHPHLVKYFINKENAYSTEYGIKIPMKCPDCGFPKSLTISNLKITGFCCPKCSDGVPYTEKFMFNALEQLLGKNFTTQLSKTTFKWCGKYQYDNYVNKINCIIETHGLQHYEDFKNSKWESLNEIQDNDFDKEWIARKNGIKNYIIIDCRKSDMEWIKDSIMKSRLLELLNFKESDVDWLKCHEAGCSNAIKKSCEMWNNEVKNIKLIADKLKVCSATIWKHLKKGAKLGWCDYDPTMGTKMRGTFVKKVICLTTGEIYDSQTKAEEKMGVPTGSVSSCCTNRTQSAGKHSETGEPLIWMFYDDYVLNKETVGWLEKYIINRSYSNKVICLNTNEVFNSPKDAGLKYNIHGSNISACCKGNLKSSGRNPITGEKLKWEFYNNSQSKGLLLI